MSTARSTAHWNRKAEIEQQNRRDLLLAWRALELVGGQDASIPELHQLYAILKAIVRQLQENKHYLASPKQRVLCRKVLGDREMEG